MTANSVVIKCVMLLVGSIFLTDAYGQNDEEREVYEFIGFGVPSTFHSPPRIELVFDFEDKVFQIMDTQDSFEFCRSLQTMFCISFGPAIISIPNNGVIDWEIDGLTFSVTDEDIFILGEVIHSHRVSVKKGLFEVLQYYYTSHRGIFMIIDRMDESPYMAQAFLSKERNGIPITMHKGKK